jgi:hypothetical protein
VVLAAATAGCGSSGSTSSGSKTVPKAQIISRGDAICSKLDKTVGAPPNIDPAKATGKQLRQFVPFLTKNAAVISSEVSQVSALGKPDKDAALFNQVLTDGRNASSYFREAATAAAAGNRGAFLAAFKKLMAQTPRGKAFGFRHCDVPSS